MALLAEATVESAGSPLLLVLDNGAVIAAEDLRDKSVGAMLAELARAQEAGESPKRGTMRALLFAATRQNHAELTPDACMDLVVRDAGIDVPLTNLLVAYLKLKDPGAGEALPPKGAAKPRRAKRTGKTF